MKYLLILFSFLANILNAQSDVDIQNTIMNSFSERSTFFSDMKSATLEVNLPKQSWVCVHDCLIMLQFDDAIESILEINHAEIFNNKLKHGTIVGRLLDMDSKEPLLFASVGFYKKDKLLGGVETDLDGNYTLSNLEPGIYDLEYSYVGYQTLLIKGVEIKLVNPPNPSLHIYDEKTQEALIGTNVLIYQDNKYLTGTSADLNGNVSLMDLKSDLYRFQFRYLGYKPIDTLMQIGQMSKIEIPMRKSNFVLQEVVIVEYKSPLIFGCGTTQGRVETVCELMPVDEKGPLDERSIELANNRSFGIFPNPTSDYCQMFVKEEVSFLLLTNQEGRLVDRIDKPATGLLKIPVFDLPAGTYILSLKTAKGMLHERLVVVK